MDTLPSISKRPPSGTPSAATPTAAAAPLQRPASAGSEGPAIALAELQKRLPPIQPPRTVPYKRRPAPHALSYEHQQPRRVVKRTDDYEKLYVQLDSKDQAQARAAVEAAEQHSWTRILLDHLHRVANLEESVVYRENGAREALVREEDRVFAMIKAESDAKSTRIRGRDLVSLQLKMHLFAIAQDEGRKAVAAEESTSFAQLRHKEVIYRPQDDESVRRSRSTANNKKRSGSSPSRRTASPTRQHPSSTTAGDSSTTAAILKPAPPPSAPVQQSYAAQGRRMWGHQKQTRQQISEADAAVGFAVSSEQSQRESLEGVELGEFLAIERQRFEERHLVPKRTEDRLIREAAAFALLQEAHKLAAQDAVLLIMNHVLVEAASQMQSEEAAAAAVPSNAVDDTVAVETKPDVASTGSPSQAALPVCETPTSTTTDPIAVDSSSTVVSAQTTRRVSRTSSFKHAEAPTDTLGRQRLMSASKEAVEQANKGEQLLTALEIVTIVDEVHHRQQSHAGDEAWKTSGIAALRAAQLSIEQREETTAASAVDNNSSAAAPPPPCEVVEPQSNGTTEPQAGEPQIAAAAPPPRLIGPSLFPGIDVLCDVMLDGDNIDAHVPWKLFLSAVLEAENETPSEPSHNVRRLFEGHRNSQLNREYLEHVLWRVSGMHHGVVNALELMPTRWKGYASQSELEEEEVLEVVHGETLVRERLIRDQINEYCSLLHFVHVRRTQSLSQPRTE